MKWKIATAVASAIAVGACGVAIVQAQSKPPSYLLAQINVKDDFIDSIRFCTFVGHVVRRAGNSYFIDSIRAMEDL